MPGKWKNSAGNAKIFNVGACACIPRKWKNLDGNAKIIMNVPGKWKNLAGNAIIINAHAHAYLENEKTRPEMFLIINVHVPENNKK
jgi:hypothetical protein